MYEEGKGQWGPKWRGKAAWRRGLPVYLEDEVGLSKAESRKIVYGLREELQELAQLVLDRKAARNRAEGVWRPGGWWGQVTEDPEREKA